MGGEGDHGAAALDQAPFRKQDDAKVCAEALRHREEQARFAALRPPMTLDEAKLILQRKGRTVYRASVAGGRADRWYVSGLGNQVTDAQLIAKAKDVAGVVARP